REEPDGPRLPPARRRGRAEPGVAVAMDLLAAQAEQREMAAEQPQPGLARDVRLPQPLDMLGEGLLPQLVARDGAPYPGPPPADGPARLDAHLDDVVGAVAEEGPVRESGRQVVGLQALGRVPRVR